MTTFMVEQDELGRFSIRDLVEFSKKTMTNIIIRDLAKITYGKIEYFNRVH